MILITGMPRSGTTFIQRIFAEYGSQMNPKMHSSVAYKPHDQLNLSEPGMISKMCIRGASRGEFRQGMEQLKRHWNKQEDLVIKLPQLCFFPGVCGEFSKIIVCVSSIDGRYLKSAKAQNLQGWLTNDAYFLRPLKSKTLEGLAAFWSQQSHDLKRFHPNKIQYYEFGQKKTFDAIFSQYMSQDLVDEAYQKHWRGSRF